jgi:hypothetical protein
MIETLPVLGLQPKVVAIVMMDALRHQLHRGRADVVPKHWRRRWLVGGTGSCAACLRPMDSTNGLRRAESERRTFWQWSKYPCAHSVTRTRWTKPRKSTACCVCVLIPPGLMGAERDPRHRHCLAPDLRPGAQTSPVPLVTQTPLAALWQLRSTVTGRKTER